jgi:hypothetical protein
MSARRSRAPVHERYEPRAPRVARYARRACAPVLASHFGFHSRASFCASAICAGVIFAAIKSRSAVKFPPAAAKLSYMCAMT